MTKLLLIRHGESEANREKKFAGHIDLDLTETGVSQAKKTAEFILENYDVTKVYASDLKRAFKTGKTVSDLAGVEIVSNQNLREIYAGSWEGNTFDYLTQTYENEYKIWVNDIGVSRPTGGESVKELGERILNVLTEIAKENDGKTIAVATHATPVRVMQSLVQTGSLEEMKNISWVSNASVSEFIYNSCVWTTGKISQDEHLGELRTVLGKNV